MARYLLLTFAFLLFGVAAISQTSLQGTVEDAESGEPIIFGTVALYKNDVLITGTETDFEGFFSITELDAGTYDIVFSYTGYADQKVTGVLVTSGRANTVDVKLSSGINLDVIEVVYERPLIEKDNTTQGLALSSEQIRNLPTRNVNALASLGAGVSSADEGGAITIRGSRSNATDYYIDGIRYSGRMPPKQDIEELQVITGGVEARYGDVTGGIISITTKGPSDRFSGGMELETSEFLDAYGQRLASLNVSGPIWKKKGETILGYRFSGQYLYNKDDDPPATSVAVATDEYIQKLEQNPVRVVGNTVFPEGQFATNENVEFLDYNPNEERTTYDLNGKLDANLGNNIDLTLTGSFYQIDDRFTPSKRGNNSWQVFNSQNNPTQSDTRYRANFRFRHRLGTNTTVNTGGEAPTKGSLIQNAAYTLQFGYEREEVTVADPRHKDNLFNYGYVGDYDLSWEPSIEFDQENAFNEEYVNPNGDTVIAFVNSFFHSDYTRTLNGYTANTEINPVITGYLVDPEDFDDFADFQVLNSRVPNTVGSIWTDLHANVGSVYNLNRVRNNDIFTFNANTSFELVPGGSGNSRHKIQFGLWWEQRVQRGYDINPFDLWAIARLHQNEHLEGQGLSDEVVGFFERPYQVIDAFTQEVYEDTTLQYPIYAPAFQESVLNPDSTENTFFRKVREKFGVPINQFFNVDGVNPSDLDLSMFSARELNDQGVLNYWGYDYLGNQIDDVTFDDFFTAEDANGIRTFPVAAFRPNYQAAFIQDKFTYKDIIFRVGLRVDRFDANTKVLKDPYSLYEVISAADFRDRFNATIPGNIEDDYKVYVTSQGGETIQAFRDGDTWYFANGTPANEGNDIFGGGLVFPRYSVDDETQRDVTSRNFNPDISFEDYEPQVNWMPRLAFSFPISDEANFFAHYDVLVQRPPSNSLVSPLTYFYWETSGSSLRNNANLKPERTVDYEVGFQQKLSNTSALKISAYYKELRDMIQSRWFLNVPAPVNQYETYDNLDFATVKGFSVAYDLRRTGNMSLNLSYTLQFADGTGSDANTSRGISSRGIQRALFPMSFDERHRIAGILDYRYRSGKEYNGPRISGVDILANTGLNLSAIAVSGRPYTAAQTPQALGAAGIKGAINGSRLPWNFTLNAQIDKSFTLTKADASKQLGLNVYIRVSNLLDRRNIVNVYRATGSPEDDGFLTSAQGQSFLAGGLNNGLSLDAFLASYNWRLLNPDNFSLPRRIFMGAVVNF